MNILLLLAHSIEEYDQVRLLHDLGYNVFSIGAYTDPAHPGDDKRPALPQVPYHRELAEACARVRREAETAAGPPGPRIDWAKAALPGEVVDWCDVVIVHHFEHQWIPDNWERIREKRVIWRTVGQSLEGNERTMQPFRDQGLQIVRYSPKERNIPGYAGEDALIRFYKDPDEWHGWTGDGGYVANITQNLYQRHPSTNWEYWHIATQGLDAKPAGPGSEAIGGVGPLSYEAMQGYLMEARCYLYTGTQPASYTLGLIEAMMTGVPVVSIGPSWMHDPDLYEGAEIVNGHAGPGIHAYEEPSGYPQGTANWRLRILLENEEEARATSEHMRRRAIELFGMETVGAAWKAFLGSPA